MIRTTIKRSILSLIILLPMTIFSSENTLRITKQDSIVSVTASELKETNLIFIEHNKFRIENNLLKNQCINYQNIINNQVQTDSIKTIQLNSYKDKVNSLILDNSNLTNRITQQKSQLKYWKIGGFTVAASLLLILLLK